MKEPSWTDGGATAPTIAGTFSTFAAGPIGGIGVLSLLFGGWIPGIAFSIAGLVMWFGGKWLMNR